MALYSLWFSSTLSSQLPVKAVEEVMEGKSLANLTLKVDPAALREIIANGELLKFVDAVAAQAASQISAQIVWYVAQARPEGAADGVVAKVEFHEIFSDGDKGFGTGRFPHPWPPVVSAGGPGVE
jgi:hypothetical protein